MMKIIEKENFIVKKALEAQKQGKDIYIQGVGELGGIVFDALKQAGVLIKAFCVNKAYLSEENKMYKNVPVIAYENILSEKQDTKKSLIIIAYRIKDKVVFENDDKVEYLVEDVFSLWGGQDTIISKQYLDNNYEKFEKIYEILEDDRSKECMEAYLNQKISGKLKYLDRLYEDNQYYDDKIVDFKKIKDFVDCGAYDGDSYRAFLNSYEKKTGETYKGNAFLFEPDEKNYSKMRELCENKEGLNLFNIGIWNEEGILKFANEQGTSSGIDEEGICSIKVNSIDNVINESVDFIKMDIEGVELKALEGARNSIKKYHPILAICAYHRKDDLYSLVQYIQSLSNDYKFYLRPYSRYCQEIVLYAVC